MSDSTFKLSGDITVGEACGSISSGRPSVAMQLDESMELDGSPMISQYELTSDAVQAVALGGLSQVNVVVIKSVGGKVRVRLSSSDGATQAIAVDSFALIMSDSVAYTALDIMRVAGTSTTVEVLLGKKA